jgi:hypothetical protein
MRGGNQQQMRQAMQLMLGGRMLQPPAMSGRPGAPPPTLSAAGQNPMLANIQRLYGVDAETAMRMLAMMQPGGGSAMQPTQQTQAYYSGPTFPTPSQTATPRTAMLLPSSMPTPDNPWGTPRTAMGPTTMLPHFGQRAFMPPSAANPTQTQSPYGAFA